MTEINRDQYIYTSILSILNLDLNKTNFWYKTIKDKSILYTYDENKNEVLLDYKKDSTESNYKELINKLNSLYEIDNSNRIKYFSNIYVIDVKPPSNITDNNHKMFLIVYLDNTKSKQNLFDDATQSILPDNDYGIVSNNILFYILLKIKMYNSNLPDEETINASKVINSMFMRRKLCLVKDKIYKYNVKLINDVYKPLYYIDNYYLFLQQPNDKVFESFITMDFYNPNNNNAV